MAKSEVKVKSFMFGHKNELTIILSTQINFRIKHDKINYNQFWLP